MQKIASAFQIRRHDSITTKPLRVGSPLRSAQKANTSMRNRFNALAVILTVTLVSGCATPPPSDSPRIETVLVQPFACSDPVIAAAVQNVFIHMLSSYSTARIVRDGSADVVIEGTVTFVDGSTSQGAVGGSANSTFGTVFGSSESAAGNYVAGITALATRNGDVVASANWGQTLKGGKILPPETVARQVAAQLLGPMKRAGLELK